MAKKNTNPTGKPETRLSSGRGGSYNFGSGRVTGIFSGLGSPPRPDFSLFPLSPFASSTTISRFKAQGLLTCSNRIQTSKDPLKSTISKLKGYYWLLCNDSKLKGYWLVQIEGSVQINDSKLKGYWYSKMRLLGSDSRRSILIDLSIVHSTMASSASAFSLFSFVLR